jgi:hypothetical protein
LDVRRIVRVAVTFNDMLPLAIVARAQTNTMVQSIQVCVFGRIAPMNEALAKESCGNKKTGIKIKTVGER